MQYLALKAVIIDGKQYQKDEVITIGHNKVDRLIMLGYLAEYVESPVEEDKPVKNRAVKPASKRGS